MATNDWLTAAEARIAVGLDSADTSEDTLLGVLLTGVCERLDDEFGPCVVRTITTEAQDGSATSVLLAHRPVDAVTTVIEYDRDGNGTTLTAETATTKPDDGYLIVSAEAGILERRASGSPSTFAVGEANVLVTYDAGRYANTAAVEEKFKRAAAFMLKVWFSSYDHEIVTEGAFDVPASRYPTFTIPRVVEGLLAGERRAKGTTGLGLA